jgi:hypothetical protein
MRWNVVIGGQLFSKSLRGFTTFKMELAGHEGWLMSAALVVLPFIVLGIFIKYFLPMQHMGLENGFPRDGEGTPQPATASQRA